MIEIKATDYQQIYTDLGINLNKLGCVMAPLELTPLPSFVKEKYLYKSPNPERFWIDKWVAERKAHLTLLYGLLWQTGITDQHVRDVLGGWGLSGITIDSVSYFPSPYKDENYYCVIAFPQIDEDISEAHKRLSLLPHINTFGDYKPHMTLGYLNCEWKMLNDIVGELNTKLRWKKLRVKGDIIISRK